MESMKEKRLETEVAKINALEGFEVLEQSLEGISIRMKGNPTSPFENKNFIVNAVLPSDFPFGPPRIFFKTPIFHPNVDFKFTNNDSEFSGTGEICLPLEIEGIKVWSAKYSVEDLCKIIRKLLGEPNKLYILNADAKKIWIENHDEYCEKAKIIANKYAQNI